MTEIDTYGELRSRLYTVQLQQNAGTTVTSMKSGNEDTDTNVDASDESKGQTYNSTLTVMCGSTPRIPNADADTNENSRSRGLKKGEMVQTSRPAGCDDSDKSRSRCNRCSTSTYQQQQRPVTSMVQSAHVGPTAVNMHDIDGCLATNKCKVSKQHSIEINNQGLINKQDVLEPFAVSSIEYHHSRHKHSQHKIFFLFKNWCALRGSKFAQKS